MTTRPDELAAKPKGESVEARPKSLDATGDPLSMLAGNGELGVFARRRVEESEEKFRRLVTQVQAGIAQTDLNGRLDDSYGTPRGIASVTMDITERKLDEQALRESEERFRNMADSAPVMIWVTEPDATCTYLSKSWYEFTGQTPETGLGFKWLEAVHPDDEQAAHQVFAAANEKREPFRLEYRLRGKDGKYRWAIDTARPRMGANGQFLGYIGSVIDITERRDTERALKESEERFRSLIQATTQITWTNDAEGKMRGEQQSWAAFTGQKFADYQGYGWSRSVHPEDSAPTIREWQQAVAKREMFVWEHRVLRHDGEYRMCTIRAIPILETDGTIREWIGAHTDISDQRALEVHSRLLADRLAAAQEAAKAGIFDWDISGGTLYWSSELYVLLGLTPRKVVPSTEEWTRRIVEEDREKAWQMFRDASAQKRPNFTIEVRVLLPGGNQRWIRVSNKISYDERGRVVRLVGLAIDIQALKESADRERVLREHAERAVRFSETFVGILGHDLRNPLSAIMMSANLLERRAETETIAKPVSRIVVSANRMERMIAQLLDFTRIRLGHGIPLDRKDVDLAHLAREIIEELVLVHKSDIQLEAFGETSGTWDRDRLGQLLSNLAANACLHGEAGAPILIQLDGSDKDVVHIEVRNRGTIPAELLPTLFEPLRPNEQYEKREGSSGLGIGLYITEQIALAHGCSIRVESREPEGTRFVVELPRRSPKVERVFGDEVRPVTDP